jgi:hypothetical protein
MMPEASRNADAGRVVTGIGAIMASFLLPDFILRLGILVFAAMALGSVLLRRSLGPERARAMTAGAMLVTFSSVVGLGLSEVVVRIALADVTTTDDNGSYFSRKWRRSLPPPNTLGYRERDVAPEPAPGVYRIAVIGDSFTFGQGIEIADRMTEQLAHLLKDRGRDFEILNFGTSGHATIHHLRTLKDVVLPLKPHFVLMQWYMNDVVDPQADPQPPAPAPLVPSDAATQWLRRRSALYYIVNRQWVALQTRVGLVEGHNSFMQRRFRDPESAEIQAATRALREFIESARAADVGVGIVAFPDLIHAAEIADFSMGHLIDRVMEVCALQSIGCVDLRESLLGRREEEGWWVNRFDPHPGPLVNRIAAEAVVNAFGQQWNAERVAAGSDTLPFLRPIVCDKADVRVVV